MTQRLEPAGAVLAVAEPRPGDGLPRALRVAHVISSPSGFGGAEATLRQLIGYGARRGWTQLVLNPFAANPDDPEVRDYYSPAVYRGERCQSWHRVPALRRWLATQLRGFDADVVHAHLHHASVMVASLPRGTVRHSVLSHQHGDHFRQIGSRGGELLDRAAGRRFDRVVGCSTHVERWVIDSYRYSPRRVTHVHNGWSGEPVLGGPQVAEPRIVCVARLRSQKNHRMLLDALAQVHRSIPGVELLLAGDGPEAEDLRRHAAAVGVLERVVFLGSVADIWPVLASSRVFALASDYEPLGIAALEAMAAGLPVVATAVGGLREVVISGETGYLVDQGDAAAMADRLTLLLHDDDLRHAMGEASRRLAERFRAERTGDGYADVYAELLASARA